MSGALTATYRNAFATKYDFSSVDSSDYGFPRRTSKLAVFYCTKCGTYHDAITRCPVYWKDSSENTEEKRQSAAPSVYFSSHDLRPCCDRQCNAHLNSDQSRYSLTCEENHDAEEDILSSDCLDIVTDKKGFSTKIFPEVQGNFQELKTVLTSEKVVQSLSNIKWATYEGRLLGAGYDPNFKFIPFEPVPVMSRAEEMHVLEDKNPPAPSSSAGRVLRHKLFKSVYPPQVIHQKCMRGYTKLVPPWMGWAWDKQDQFCGAKQLLYNPDWRPGAVNAKVARLIRQSYGEPELNQIQPKKKRIRRKRKEEESDVRPMIEVVKRQGCYLITMNPIKNPYLPANVEQQSVAPIHFIVDRRNQVVQEVPGCDCICSCESSSGSGDKSRCTDSYGEDSSSESEFEFSFTPPICLVDREQIKSNKNLSDIGTQFDPEISNEPKSKKKGGKKKGKKGGKGKK